MWPLRLPEPRTGFGEVAGTSAPVLARRLVPSLRQASPSRHLLKAFVGNFPVACGGRRNAERKGLNMLRKLAASRRRPRGQHAKSRRSEG